MEEDRIKSALEIALEKIAKLPDLTPDEITKQKESEYRPIGEAIAMKYLKSAIKGAELPKELGRYRGDGGPIVRRAFLSTLCESIEPGDAIRSRRAIEGVLLVAGASSCFEKVGKEFEEVFSEFEQEIQQSYARFEAIGKEKLRQLGISGSAIRPNMREKDDWQQEQNRIRQRYDLRLDRLRTRLKRLAGAIS